jgi:hypothetical protein
VFYYLNLFVVGACLHLFGFQFYLNQILLWVDPGVETLFHNVLFQARADAFVIKVIFEVWGGVRMSAECF